MSQLHENIAPLQELASMHRSADSGSEDSPAAKARTNPRAGSFAIPSVAGRRKWSGGFLALATLLAGIGVGSPGAGAQQITLGGEVSLVWSREQTSAVNFTDDIGLWVEVEDDTEEHLDPGVLTNTVVVGDAIYPMTEDSLPGEEIQYLTFRIYSGEDASTVFLDTIGPNSTIEVDVQVEGQEVAFPDIPLAVPARTTLVDTTWTDEIFWFQPRVLLDSNLPTFSWLPVAGYQWIDVTVHDARDDRVIEEQRLPGNATSATLASRAFTGTWGQPLLPLNGVFASNAFGVKIELTFIPFADPGDGCFTGESALSTPVSFCCGDPFIRFELTFHAVIGGDGLLEIYDPPVATGYDYVVTSGPNFARAVLPDGFTDGNYTIEVTDPAHPQFGQEFAVTGNRVATSFDFTTASAAGANSFRITGIEVDAGIDPADQLGFPTGLAFVDGGFGTFTMTAVTVDSTAAENEIALDPSPLDFGEVPVGESDLRNLTISNAGPDPLTVNAIFVPEGFDGTWNGTIPSGESQVVPITFSPLAVKDYDGEIVVNCNAAAGSKTVEAQAAGVAPPAPSKATGANPANGSAGQPLTTDLGWTNGGGATSFDVYFGTDATPDSGELQGNQAGTALDLATLASSTTYFWRIDPKNAGGTTTGDVWSFTTASGPQLPPSKATGASPANGSTGQPLTTDLSWSDGGGATSYDVYFGTDATPDSGELQGNQAGTAVDLATLAASTTYYWRIDPMNASGTTTGDVWSFTTASAPPLPPSKATGASPVNGSAGQALATDLSWSNGGGATSFDVYFGTDATPDSGELQGNQAGTTLDLPALAYSTTYYWRIDPKNSGGTTTGDVWSFTTMADPVPSQPGTPIGSGTTLLGLSGKSKVTILYRIDVPEGQALLRATTLGGKKDVNLYLRREAQPTLSEYDARSIALGTFEVCDVIDPEAGLWYLWLQTPKSFKGVDLRVFYSPIAAQPDLVASRIDPIAGMPPMAFDDYYSFSGVGQLLKVSLKRKTAEVAEYGVRLQNDGPESQAMTLTLSGSLLTRGVDISVTRMSDGANVTAQVLAGLTTTTLASGASDDYIVRIAPPLTAIKGTADLEITAEATGDALFVDVLRIQCKVK